MDEEIGRTIKLFLSEGHVGGIIIANMMNWTGKLIVIPRSDLPRLADRDDAKRTGVYFLVGPDAEKPDQERVYVGESDNVFERLVQHEKKGEKEFWTRTVFVVSNDENLTKAHTLFLESEFISLIETAGRALVDNGTRPTKKLPESDTCDMRYFLKQVTLMLPVLGFSFLQPIPTEFAEEQATGEAEPLFELSSANAVALAREINGEFVVLKGSTARKPVADSLSPGYRGRRERLVKENVLSEYADDRYVFAENVPFSSPSGAACIVTGMSVNGRTYWKHKGTGKSYQDWQEARLSAAIRDASPNGDRM